MIAARTTHRQAAEPAPRRSLMDRLLLDGMAWTNAHPGFGFAGMAVCWLLCSVLEVYL